MVRDDGSGMKDLMARLLREPHVFEFEQALALLEREVMPAAVPLGSGLDPAHEALRLTGTLTANFPWTALKTVQLPGDGKQAIVRTRFFGLGGPDGPLPYAYQEWIQACSGQSAGMADFFDIFHHRLLAVLYRARNSGRGPLPFLRQAFPAQSVLRALQGCGEEGGISCMPRNALHAERARGLGGLIHWLRVDLRMPVRARSFVGNWVRIPSCERLRVGRTHRLRDGKAVIGRRAWNEHAGIVLTLGPMSAAARAGLLPGRPGHGRLKAQLNGWFGSGLAVGLRLEVCGAGAASSQVGAGRGMLLGWTSVLGLAPEAWGTSLRVGTMAVAGAPNDVQLS